jgi:hypothetical protein
MPAASPRPLKSQSAPPGVEPGRDACDDIAIKGPVKLFRDVADMRRRDDVVERPKRMVLRQGLNIGYVKRRAPTIARDRNVATRAAS